MYFLNIYDIFFIWHIFKYSFFIKKSTFFKVENVLAPEDGITLNFPIE